MFLQQQKNVWLIFTWIWELQTYNSPFTHVIMQHGWQDAASEVVSLAEQFSESSYKIIKPAHTHTCFLTNSASSVRFLIHSSLYGVKQTNFRFLCLCWCCSFSPCISAQLMLAAASCDCEDLVLLVTCQANWHFLFLLSFYSSTFFHFFHTKLSSPKCASTQPR